MSSGEKLKKVVIGRSKNGVAIPSMWVKFLREVKRANGAGNRQEIMRKVSCGGRYSEISTNVWAALVRKGLISKDRHGRTFTYGLTESGARKLNDAEMQIRFYELKGL